MKTAKKLYIPYIELSTVVMNGFCHLDHNEYGLLPGVYHTPKKLKYSLENYCNHKVAIKTIIRLSQQIDSFYVGNNLVLHLETVMDYFSQRQKPNIKLLS